MLVAAAAAPAQAREPDAVAGAADRVEAVQQRAWRKKGGLALAPVLAGGLNDPFLWRGGAGLRLTAWPRALLGLSLEATVWGRTPSEAARVAQRELRAVMRPAGSGWAVLGWAEVAGADGKIAFGSRILHFELFGRAGAGATGLGDALSSGPTAALGAALGTRWFASGRVGLELALALRSSAAERTLAGRTSTDRDAVVALELAVPLRIGGAR